MSEKDPYAQKRKESTDESRMNDESINDNDKNSDLSGNSSRNPQDDINPVRPQTIMPNKQKSDDKDTDNSM
jgi:hypothetical protein